MCYANSCLRGIPNKSFLNVDGTPGSHLFYFDENVREDGWLELSINWEDDDKVKVFTIRQLKDDGSLQFRAGVAQLSKNEIDRINKLPMIRGVLSYERQPLDQNQYHGNILLNAEVPKPTRKMISASLALIVSEIITYEQISG